MPCAKRAAHPRVGGENVFQVRDGHAYRGSSPRRRGKPRGALPADGMERLIPA